MARAETFLNTDDNHRVHNSQTPQPAQDDGAFVGCAVNPRPRTRCPKTPRKQKHHKKRRTVHFADQDHRSHRPSSTSGYSYPHTAATSRIRPTNSTRPPTASRKMERRYWDSSPASYWEGTSRRNDRRHVRSRLPGEERSAGAQPKYARTGRGRDKYRHDGFEGREQQQQQQSRLRRGPRLDDTHHLRYTARPEAYRGTSRRNNSPQGDQNFNRSARDTRAKSASPDSLSSSNETSSDEDSDDSRMYTPLHRGAGSQDWRSKKDHTQHISRDAGHAMSQTPSGGSDSSSSGVQSERSLSPTSPTRKSTRHPYDRPAIARRESNQQSRAAGFKHGFAKDYGDGDASETSPISRSTTIPKRRRAKSPRRADMRSNIGRSRVAIVPPAPSPPLSPSPPPAPSLPSVTPTPSKQRHQYYSPDSVGNGQFSRGREGNMLETNDKVHESDTDGSFLEYGDTHSPEGGSPNRAQLLQNAGAHYQNVVALPSTISENESEQDTVSNQTVPEMEEKSLFQDEWRQLSRNLRRAQAPKQSSRVSSQKNDNQQQLQLAKKTPKDQNQREEQQPRPKGLSLKLLGGSQGRQKTEDNVSITTPTTTHTMAVPGPLTVARSGPQKYPDTRRHSRSTAKGMKENAQGKPQTIFIQFGSRPPMQMSLDKSSTLSMTSSKDDPKSDMPVIRNRAFPGPDNVENHQGIPGYTHMPRTEMWAMGQPAEGIRDDLDRSRSSATTSSRRRRSSKAESYGPSNPRRKSSSFERFGHVQATPKERLDMPPNREVMDVSDGFDEGPLDMPEGGMFPSPSPPIPVPEPSANPQFTNLRTNDGSGNNGTDRPTFSHLLDNFNLTLGHKRWPSNPGTVTSKEDGMVNHERSGRMPSHLDNEVLSDLDNGVDNYYSNRGVPRHAREAPTQHGFVMPNQQFNEMRFQHFSDMPTQRISKESIQQPNKMPFHSRNEVPIQRTRELPNQRVNSETPILQNNGPATNNTEPNQAKDTPDKKVAPKGPGLAERCRRLFKGAMPGFLSKKAADAPQVKAANTSESAKAIPSLVPSSKLRGANASRSMRSVRSSSINPGVSSSTPNKVKFPKKPKAPRIPLHMPSCRDVVLFFTRYGNYIIYFIAFGFFMMVLGRIAGFIAQVGGWIAWFAWPFVWVFGTIGQLLVR